MLACEAVAIGYSRSSRSFDSLGGSPLWQHAKTSRLTPACFAQAQSHSGFVCARLLGSEVLSQAQLCSLSLSRTTRILSLAFLSPMTGVSFSLVFGIPSHQALMVS